MTRSTESSETVLRIPQWFLVFLGFVISTCVIGVIPWAYGIGNDLAAIKTSLTTCVDRLVEQDATNDRQDREIGGLKERMIGVESQLKP